MQQDNSEQVIIDPMLIAKHYIRTWFFLDLLSSIPLDYIFLIFNAGGDVNTNNFIKSTLLSSVLFKYLGVCWKLPDFASWSCLAYFEIGQAAQPG